MTEAVERNVMSACEEVPIFGTEENRAELMAIYDEALRHWPVPLKTFFLTTRYGKTDVIRLQSAASSGPRSSPR